MMTDEEQTKALADDKQNNANSRTGAAQLIVPTLSSAATQQSFAAASNQFIALTRFGYGETDTVSIKDQVLATEQKRKDYERMFIHDGAIAINSNGVLQEIVEYSRAVEAIRAKAAALGYGALSQSVPITSVPGGYIGRFGGNDIYATTH